ncbi:MAG: ABC transporter permease [Treponemataceae bacterium]|nr:ABC transporter permease [Treponemataceae bacterium]
MIKSPYKAIVNRINKKKPLSEPARHAKRAMQKNASGKISFSMVVLVITLVFLFLPLVVIGIYSFNPSKGSEITGFSLVWYEKLIFDSSELWIALENSFIIALSSAAVSTVLGTLAAIGINWYKFKGKLYIQTVSFLPMVLPEVIIGVSMLIFFSGVGMKLGMLTIFIAHTTFCLPFVFLMVLARLDEFDFSIIEAAHDLGATEKQTMIKVIIPAIMPGIFSGFLMAVTMSLEDFVITFFVSGPGSTTLPLYVYSMIRFGVSPVINALSFVMILATMLMAFLLRDFLKTIAASQ